MRGAVPDFDHRWRTYMRTWIHSVSLWLVTDGACASHRMVAPLLSYLALLLSSSLGRGLRLRERESVCVCRSDKTWKLRSTRGPFLRGGGKKTHEPIGSGTPETSWRPLLPAREVNISASSCGCGWVWVFFGCNPN